MGTGSRWWLAAALLVAAGVVALVALRSPAASADASQPGADPAASPLWSARRLPGPIVDPLTAAGEQAAAALLQQALEDEAARFGSVCFVVARGTTVLASRNADIALIPASTQKVLVAATVLAALGPEFRFETRAVASGAGASVDRLWVVGSGDPVMRSADYVDVGISTPLDALADAVVASGVGWVGTLVADDSRYDQERYVPSWRPNYRVDLDVGPLGALVVDQGVTLASGAPTLVDDPAQEVGERLAALLRERGVAVGAVARGTAPADAFPAGSVASEPLRSIVGYMLGASDNVTAELLTKELGARLAGEGSTVAGTSAVRSTLGRLGVGLAVGPTVDGSGLDRGNRLTCADLVAVLGLAARPDLRVLHDVMPGDPRPDGDGSIRSKSGYLQDVTGIAGVVDRPSPLTYAFLVNGGVPAPSRNAAAEMRRVAGILGSYRPPDPVPDDMVPAP